MKKKDWTIEKKIKFLMKNGFYKDLHSPTWKRYWQRIFAISDGCLSLHFSELKKLEKKDRDDHNGWELKL